ncbi:MAG: sulfur oxidation c-type cytochrome SoxX [Acidiferrobacterales bacterium]
MTKKTLLASFVAATVSSLVASGALADPIIAYEVENLAIVKSLTGTPGDPAKGRQVAINRKKGNCLGCHVLPIPEQPFHGNVGPPLTGVASRLSAAQLRLRIVDPKAVNPTTIMPSFYKAAGFERVMKKFQGKTVLTAQEVEDVVAYLMTLK